MKHEFMTGDGLYQVEVENAFSKSSERLGCDLFVVEFRIVESSDPSNPDGARRVWCQRMRAAVAVHTLDRAWAEEAREMQVAELERFFAKGRNLMLIARTRYSKRDHHPFTQHTWRELGAGTTDNVSREEVSR